MRSGYAESHPPRRNVLHIELDSPLNDGSHDLEIVVEDKAGNEPDHCAELGGWLVAALSALGLGVVLRLLGRRRRERDVRGV